MHSNKGFIASALNLPKVLCGIAPSLSDQPFGMEPSRGKHNLLQLKTVPEIYRISLVFHEIDRGIVYREGLGHPPRLNLIHPRFYIVVLPEPGAEHGVPICGGAGFAFRPRRVFRLWLRPAASQRRAYAHSVRNGDVAVMVDVGRLLLGV